MKKQHQRPEFTVINIDHENEKFFVASGTVPFPTSALFTGGGLKRYPQQDNTGGLPKFGASSYDPGEEIFNW